MASNEILAALESTNTPFGVLYYFKNDEFLGRSLKEYGEWAKLEIDFISTFIRKDDVVVDGGAFIGTHALAFSRFVGQNGRVIAFEPHPVHAHVLKMNTERNRALNIELHPFGLADHDAEMMAQSMSLGELNSFGSNRLSSKAKKGESNIIVPVKTLDSFGLVRCDFIKLDIEGMEALAIKGAKRTITKCQPYVYAECNSAEGGWPVICAMWEHGYDVYIYSEEAFNSENFNHNSNNIFGKARELAIVCIPSKHAQQVRRQLHSAQKLISVETLDDVVFALVSKPQYRHEILNRSSAAKRWGHLEWVDESEFADLQKQFRTEMEVLRERATSADAHGRSLLLELDAARSEIQNLQMARQRESVDAAAQISELTRWATSADAYGKDLIVQLNALRDEVKGLTAARDRESADAAAQITELHKWAKSAEQYAKSLLSELNQVREVLGSERVAAQLYRGEVVLCSSLPKSEGENASKSVTSLSEEIKRVLISIEQRSAFHAEVISALQTEKLQLTNALSEAHHQLEKLAADYAGLQHEIVSDRKEHERYARETQKDVERLHSQLQRYRRHWVFRLLRRPATDS